MKKLSEKKYKYSSQSCPEMSGFEIYEATAFVAPPELLISY